MSVLLRAEGIAKRYGGTAALRGVDFAVEAGKVAVLIGENGAGKSTLMRILAGVETPSEGRLLIDGQPVALHSVRDAAAHGIGMVHQELNLCPNLSVAENIFLGRSERGLLLDREAERAAARALLARLGQDLDPDALVGTLGVGTQQLVEIARALGEKCRVLILDEPTSALSMAEVDVLFGVIAELKREGVGIVYISHRLEELLRIGDTISVLRDGDMVAQRDAAGASVAWIVEAMLGDAGRPERVDAPPPAGGASVLQLEGIGIPVGPEDAAVDLDFAAGTVTGIYGLLGSGRTELLELALGARRPRSGRVVLLGEDVTRLPIADRAARGLWFVPEDRKAQGLFANLPVGANMSLGDIARLAAGGIVSPAREGGAIAAMIARLGIKTAGAAAPVASLSGGNQQKVLVARALLPGPVALLLDEPSRGVDVGARADLFATIRSLAADGLAVVFTTSDVVEALAMADRLVVLAGGRVTLDIAAAEADETALINAANTVAAPGPAKAAQA